MNQMEIDCVTLVGRERRRFRVDGVDVAPSVFVSVCAMHAQCGFTCGSDWLFGYMTSLTGATMNPA